MKFEEKVEFGACIGCGHFFHEELAGMTDSQLITELWRLVKQTPMESIGEFGDQQGCIGKLLCVEHELKRRGKDTDKLTRGI